MDISTEADIMKLIFERMKNKTIIMITHRNETLRYFEKTISNTQEVIARGGKVLMITNDKLEFDGKDINSGFTSFLQGLSISLLNPKIFIWFVAIYSQFMSVDNDMIFNTILILTASIIDAIWYVILTLLVTTNIALDFIKDKSVLLEKFVGSIFIIIGTLLLIELLI